MKKRIKSIIMAAVMLFTVLSVCGADVKTAYAEGDIKVTFHYSNPEGIYDSEHYSLGIWTDVQGGIQYLFFDATGTATVTLVGNPTEIGFFVKNVQESIKASANGGSGIIKDTGEDRTINLTQIASNNIEVKLTAGVSEFTATAASSTPSADENSTGGSEVSSETVTQMTSDDPKADYSPSSATIVVVDLIIIVGVAVLSYQIYSRQKNPITGNMTKM